MRRRGEKPRGDMGRSWGRQSKACKDMGRRVKTLEGMDRCRKACEYMEGTQRHSKVCEGMRRHANIWEGMRRDSKACEGARTSLFSLWLKPGTTHEIPLTWKLSSKRLSPPIARSSGLLCTDGAHQWREAQWVGNRRQRHVGGGRRRRTVERGTIGSGSEGGEQCSVCKRVISEGGRGSKTAAVPLILGDLNAKGAAPIALLVDDP